MKMNDILKSRLQKKAASFPAGVYREQLERKQNEGSAFKRDPDAEQVILRKWEISFLYSKYVLKGTWPEFEALLSASPVSRNILNQKAAFNYANDVKRGPVEGVEKQVSLNGELAADYAISIAKEPWDPANPEHQRALNSIASHPQASETYEDAVNYLASSNQLKRA